MVKNKNVAAVGPSTPQVQSILQGNPPVVIQEQQRQQIQPAVPKVQQKVHAVLPFNIVENMKRMNVSISMWDSLSLLG